MPLTIVPHIDSGGSSIISTVGITSTTSSIGVCTSIVSATASICFKMIRIQILQQMQHCYLKVHNFHWLEIPHLSYSRYTRSILLFNDFFVNFSWYITDNIVKLESKIYEKEGKFHHPNSLLKSSWYFHCSLNFC